MENKIAEYIRKVVIGRRLVTDDVIYFLEEGKLEGVYSDKIIFSDLTVSENGIQFNMTTVSEEKIYFKNMDGSRGEISEDYTGTSVFRYNLALRKSTSQITGFVHCISTTVKDQTMEAVVYGVYDIEFVDGHLKWKEQQLFYRDSPAEKGNYRPVAFDSSIRFYMDKDKLVFEYAPVYSDVDPVTFRKTYSKDKYPVYTSREK